MQVIRFLLQTEQPILATSLQGDPNSDVSYPYIPGSMIRGMIIGRYFRQKKVQELDILDLTIRRLFFEDSTRYLNAYLFDSEKQHRTLPTPLCLYKEKGDEDLKTVFDSSQTDIEDRPESPKRLEKPFCWIDECSQLSLYEIKRWINIHNQRDRQKGRGTEATGEVFRYEAIDSGQTFEAVIFCDRDEDAEIIKNLLEPEKEIQNSEKTDRINVWLGGSQSAGYGHTTISPNEIKSTDISPNEIKSTEIWNEIGINWQDRSERKNNLTVTLLSDTILRDEWGQITTEPERLVDLISKLLKTELKLIDTYASSTIVGGFNRKWGLPLPQVQAIAAGSVFIFKCPENSLDPQAVRDLETQGIGERRVDGFGRVVLNWLPENSEINAEQQVIKPNIDTQPLNDQEKQIAQDIAQKILREKLDELLIEQVSEHSPDKKQFNLVQNNQLSRLMIITKNALNQMQAGLPNDQPHVLNSFIGKDRESSQMSKAGKEQLSKIQMNNGDPFDKQVREWLNPSNQWIQLAWRKKFQANYFTNEDEEPAIKIANQPPAVLDSSLYREYTLRLILGITKKMMKEKNNA
ncbi:CRISPR-associated family protein [Lyngbya aestuarii BL J]|uniref:CRISPR-associated family protein n=1 Tax=Lyngbya aestuarii BL J TaxID=1348334 RepID=U7QK55_9CYAN|nr:type III-B CRISPR module-associated Cmr3 family protein [Lyngbya aestuarii]ERT08349.1 CRISPR-associated family protein [Lyngbya aestuarii BL J]